MLKVKIFFIFLLYAVIVNGQTSFDLPSLDTNSKSVALLFKQKKNDDALALINKLISEKPSDGINYFNRAVVKYSKQVVYLKQRKYILNGKYYNVPEDEKYFIISNTGAEEIRSPLWYSLAKEIIEDCKKAKQNGYRNSELYYLLFSVSYDCDPSNFYYTSCLYDSAVHVASERYKQLKSLVDSTLNFQPWSEKYLWARIELLSKYKITNMNWEERIGDIQILRKDCEKIVQVTKNSKRKQWAYFNLADTYKTYYLDTLKAIQYLSAAIDIDPKFNDYILYAERGKLRASFSNNYEEAINDFNIYLLNWVDADIYCERAVCYFILNKSDDALKDFNSAIILYEQQRKKILLSNLIPGQLDYLQVKWASAYHLRGLVNINVKNEKEALRDFNKAIEYGSIVTVEAKNELLQSFSQYQNDGTYLKNSINSNSIPMVKRGGVYEIPITINNTLKINFIFDAGASDVSISADVALTLIRTGTVSDKDFIGTATYKFADGSMAKSKVFILKELQIGNRKITNIRTSISNSLDAPLLLGQSVLNRFGKVTIDYKNSVIVFED